MGELLPNPIRLPKPESFTGMLTSLERRFRVYADTSPQPLPAPGLVIDRELRCQSELYLPLAELAACFGRYYRASLSHLPFLGSTPFAQALSWADLFVQLPHWLQQSPNPAVLLRTLLHDPELHERFIYYSFLPPRFNGNGFGRYPGQLAWLGGWLPAAAARAGDRPLACLDAACGSGEGAWELAEAARGCRIQPHIEGWTLDPLEVYAAQQRYLPHLPQRQQQYRQRVEPLLLQGWGERIRFQALDLLADDLPEERFDLIVCNGLLGGPLVGEEQQVGRLIGRLATALLPGGLLLAANHFHGGWQSRMPQERLAALCQRAGLRMLDIPEGICAQRGAT